MVSAEVAEYPEPALLVVVQAVIEGICGVRQFLQGRTPVGKGCGPLPQVFYRIVRGAGAAGSAHAVGPQLPVFPRGLLKGGPVLLLVRRECEAGLERRQPGLTEGSNILCVGLPPLAAVETAALLRIDERRAGNDRKRCRSGNNRLPHDVPSRSRLSGR